MKYILPAIFFCLFFSCKNKGTNNAAGLSVTDTTYLSYGDVADFGYMNKTLYNHRGKVKNLIIHSADEKENVLDTASVWFDVFGRIVKERASFANAEYDYPDSISNKFLYKKDFDKDGKQISFTYDTYRTDGAPLIDWQNNMSGYNYLFYYDYHSGGYERNYFTDTNQVFSVDSFQNINLNDVKLSRTLVPFEIDSESSTFTEHCDIDYANANSEYGYHNREYVAKIFEKGQPENWVEFNINQSDRMTAGSGTWNLYKDGLPVKNTNVYWTSGDTSLSDFGTVYTYNRRKQIMSKIYDYFGHGKENIRTEDNYRYDSLGNIIEMVYVEHGKIWITKKFVYEYDSLGNWIKMKYYSGNELKNIYTRTIQYYTKGEPSFQSSITPQEIEDAKTKVAQQIADCRKSFEIFKQKLLTLNDYTIPDKNLVSKNWKDFVNSTWQVDTVTTGDLNGDGIPDLVFASEPAKINKNIYNDKRDIKILFKDAQGNYRLAAQSNKALFSEWDKFSKVFFSGFEIEKDTLIVYQDFIRGGSRQKYKYIAGNIYLIEASRRDGNASYSSSAEYNFITGRFVSTHDTYSDDEQSEDHSTKTDTIIPPPPLISIENYEAISVEINGEIF